MQKILVLSLMLAAIMLAVPVYAEAFPVQTVSELIENAKALDGTEVTITAEMIGDVMKRGEYAWINGLDSTGAMGLWVPAELASEVKIVGNGKYIGDTFTIQGSFHRACREHGGDMDIHVTSMKLAAPGHEVNRSIPQSKLFYAGLLSLIGLCIGGIFLRRRFT